jgi:hypothetical protein
MRVFASSRGAYEFEGAADAGHDGSAIIAPTKRKRPRDIAVSIIRVLCENLIECGQQHGRIALVSAFHRFLRRHRDLEGVGRKASGHKWLRRADRPTDYGAGRIHTFGER